MNVLILGGSSAHDAAKAGQPPLEIHDRLGRIEERLAELEAALAARRRGRVGESRSRDALAAKPDEPRPENAGEAEPSTQARRARPRKSGKPD